MIRAMSTTSMFRSTTRAAIAAFSITLPMLVPAQKLDRSKAPQPADPPTVRVAEAKTEVLPNGLKLIVVENHKLPVVSVQFRFDHVPVIQGEIAGYQDLMGELLTSGTARSTKEEFDERVDRIGAHFSGSTDGIYASSLKKNMRELMNLVYEVVVTPAFPATEFENARKRYLSGLKSRVDDPSQIATEVGRALTYGKRHPYGEVATEASVAKIKREHIVTYYQRFFQPENGYLVFVGDITLSEARESAKSLFGEWKGSEYTSTTDANGLETVRGLGPLLYAGQPPVANGGRNMSFVDRPGSAQSVIKAVFPVDMKPGDPLALSAQVMNTILGGGVFNARLMQNLRESRAFTYGAYSSLDADRYCGSFTAGCSVRNDVTDSAITEIMFEIERMREQPVTEAELTLAKNYMAGSFARSLEDPRTIARFALNTELYGLPKDHYATYLKRLDTVSAASVLDAARRFLNPDNANVLTVGDKASVGNKLAPLSYHRTVVYYDANGDIYREAFEMPPAGMTAQQVIDAYFKAIGGVPAAQKVKSLKKEYTAELEGMSVTLTEQHAAPLKYAMKLGSGPVVLQQVVYDGTRGKKSGMEGSKELVDQDLEDARQSAFIFPELHYTELDYGPKLNGIVEINGRKCYRVAVTKAAGGAYTDYYDMETGLRTRRTETQSTEEGNFAVTTDFSDYKAVNGVLFPHTIAQNAGMNMVFTAKVIAVNPSIPETEFLVQ